MAFLGIVFFFLPKNDMFCKDKHLSEVKRFDHNFCCNDIAILQKEKPYILEMPLKVPRVPKCIALKRTKAIMISIPF